MISIVYIKRIIGIMVLASLAACGTPSLRTNCWAKAPEVTRGPSGGACE